MTAPPTARPMTVEAEVEADGSPVVWTKLSQSVTSKRVLNKKKLHQKNDDFSFETDASFMLILIRYSY